MDYIEMLASFKKEKEQQRIAQEEQKKELP
jgi:hypothetical protein